MACLSFSPLSIKIPSVASKHIHVNRREKHVLVACKYDMFWRQTFEVWSRWLSLTSFVFAQQNILCKHF